MTVVELVVTSLGQSYFVDCQNTNITLDRLDSLPCKWRINIDMSLWNFGENRCAWCFVLKKIGMTNIKNTGLNLKSKQTSFTSSTRQCRILRFTVDMFLFFDEQSWGNSRPALTQCTPRGAWTERRPMTTSHEVLLITFSFSSFECTLKTMDEIYWLAERSRCANSRDAPFQLEEVASQDVPQN